MPFSVLIVDDNAAFRQMLRAVFARAGDADVREAGDGAGALAAFEAAPADLVLADQSMPGMRGTALLAALRARSPQVRLMLLTGHKSAALTAEARAAGADAVLEKPISPRALMQAVNEAMAR